MPKFNQPTARVAHRVSPIVTTSTPMPTAEGGAGFQRTAKGELYLLAVTNMVGEDTFYEGKTNRDTRFRGLVAAVTAEDPGWVARLIPWLRGTANMRSASVVAAAEYAHAGGLNRRQVIASTLQRADEPGEFLAYWHSRFGRRMPHGVQRGVADAVTALYTERAAIKYNGARQLYRLADVVELTHPTPKAAWQGDLFRWLLDRRHHPHGRTGPFTVEDAAANLPVIRGYENAQAVPLLRRRQVLREWLHEGRDLSGFGFTWENLSGWLDGPMDAEAWTAILPAMGYMARLRNLRNLDEAGVSDEVAQRVATDLADPAKVATSKQLPLRFLSAYRATPSLRWAWALEQALQHSLEAVPSLPGRTLILIDRSGSMFWSNLSARSTVTYADTATLFGLALAQRATDADVFVYGSTHQRVALPPSGSLLPLLGNLPDLGGTETWQTLAAAYDGHDRVVVLTDEQADLPSLDVHRSNPVPASVPMVTFNLAGYQVAHAPTRPNWYTVGGLSDAGFRMIGLLEQHGQGDWPF